MSVYVSINRHLIKHVIGVQALQRRKSYDTEYHNQPEIEVHEISQL